MNITQVSIPRGNWGGQGTNQLKLIVLHWAVCEIDGCDATFKNPDRKASAHYCVGSNGEVHQYVQDHNVAWHAGPTVNYKSIGIEHAGGYLLSDGTRKKPTQVCHDTSAQLVADKCRQYGIPCDREHITRHSQWMNTECPGTLDVEYIIQKANSIINGTPMTPFDFTLSDDGTNIHLVMNQSASGAFQVKDVVTGQQTDAGNILNGTDKIVSPNHGKRLYEVTFNGVTHQLDLRDVTPTPEPTPQPTPVNPLQAELDAANAKITDLNMQLTAANNTVSAMSGQLVNANNRAVVAEQEQRRLQTLLDASGKKYSLWDSLAAFFKGIWSKIATFLHIKI